MLLACSAKQVIVPPTTIVSPDLDIGKVQRTVPATAMGLPENFPQVPADLYLYPPEQQAAIIVDTWVESAKVFALTEANRQALIEWINQSIEKDTGSLDKEAL